MEYITQHFPDVFETILQYKAGYDPFKSYMFTEGVVDKVTPACWWPSMSSTLGKDVT